MAQLPKYYIVEAKALPEVFLKVAEAKWLLETGEVATVNDASYDPKAKELRANLTVLSEEEASKVTGPLQNHGDRQDIGWPTEAGSASLFIDPIVLCSNPQTCNSSSTVNYTYNQTIYFSTTIINSVS